MCIVGDFNFPSIKWNGELSGNTENEFVECIRDAFLSQVVKHPTKRREDQKPSLTDPVFVNDELLVSDVSHSNPFGKSDHETLLFNLYLNNSKISKEDVYKYDFTRKVNFKDMKSDLSKIDCTELSKLSVHDCWIVIKNKIVESMDKHFPKRKVKEGNCKPHWLTNRIQKNVRK